MRKKKTHGSKSPNTYKRESKDKQIKGETHRAYRSFTERPKTMWEVAISENIERPNICRYVGKWKKSNKIGVAKLGKCPISKENGVQFLTTNPDLFLKPKKVK